MTVKTHVNEEGSTNRPASAGHNANGAPGSWATDPTTTLEEKVRRWAIFAIMHQRGIQWADLVDELGITRARVGQLFRRAGVSEKAYQRIEEAIEAITERKHAACHVDNDPNCAVYTAIDPDDRLVKAKLGALEAWRNDG